MLIVLLVELCELRFELLSCLTWFSANRWRFTEDLKNCIDKWFVNHWKIVALVEALEAISRPLVAAVLESAHALGKGNGD